MSNVTIFTGAEKSGKTTSLFHFVNRHQSCDGILQPVIDGRRHLYFIGERKLVPLETENPQEHSVAIGQYRFRKKAFFEATDYLKCRMPFAGAHFIIDEIGHLELRGEGMEPGLSDFFSSADSKDTFGLILVVRTKLLTPFQKQYNSFFPGGYLITENI